MHLPLATGPRKKRAFARHTIAGARCGWHQACDARAEGVGGRACAHRARTHSTNSIHSVLPGAQIHINILHPAHTYEEEPP